MKVVVDKHIPYLEEVAALGEELGEWVFVEPEAITPEAVRDADALIVRTRTRCDRLLLEGSRVQFVATATIGYDHIDTDYCAGAGIRWTNCPGCNAQGVCDYVESALEALGKVKGEKGKVKGAREAIVRSVSVDKKIER